MAHHPAVTDHIGSQDRRKPPMDTFLGHRSPPSRALEVKFYVLPVKESIDANFPVELNIEAT